MADLVVSGLSKSYAAVSVLREIGLAVPDGRFCALLGPSGSGKTSLLRSIAGFIDPDAGRIIIGGRDVTHVPPHRRGIGIVFQSYALFPHLSVADNVAFGLRMQGVGRAEMTRRVREMLALVGLSMLAQRRPAELSGGQQQRVALARALVIRPQILLLDEPLSALDRKIREEMRSEIKRLHRETGTTTVMVTHDQEEAVDLADELVLMDHGQIEQTGTPAEISRSPASAFVANFMGGHPLPAGRLRRQDAHWVLQIAEIDLPYAPRCAASSPPEGAVAVVIQPEHVRIGPAAAGGMAGTVRAISNSGVVSQVFVDVPGLVIPGLIFSKDAEHLAVGVRVAVHIDPAGVHCFPINS
jgi:ABC-type Fe3+/spermidine/putrescine transport system ATPase subunit